MSSQSEISFNKKIQGKNLIYEIFQSEIIFYFTLNYFRFADSRIRLLACQVLE